MDNTSWLQYILSFSSIGVVLTALLSITAATHAILFKRDPRVAVAWTGFILFLPIGGALAYFLLGINRIERRAKARFSQRAKLPHPSQNQEHRQEHPTVHHLDTLQTIGTKLELQPLTYGNRITPLLSGDEAYPTMLTAIAQAKTSITLCTYIFDRDAVGKQFAQALADAVKRGVEVRVLVDDIGARYSFPSIVSLLRRHNIPVAKFLPTRLPWRFHYAQLRNHRKIMVVDGQIGFTGGINIRDDHWLAKQPNYCVTDLHFQVEGPIVTQLQEVFAEDWYFSTSQILDDLWFPNVASVGKTIARGIKAGPDEATARLVWILHGALAAAKHRVQIMTPYFLPNQVLIHALNLAALRGVHVEIILPAKNNLILVEWASTALLWQVLEHGCRVYLSPQPFDHSKLMIVDDYWVLLGSANWDPRSLRLNFEFNLECYDKDFAQQLALKFEQRRQASRPISLDDVDSRSWAIRLRDGVARLLMPYL